MAKERSNKISIYLIKQEIKYEEILKSYAYDYVFMKNNNSTTYFYPTRKKEPNWLISYFKKKVGILKLVTHMQKLSLFID